MSSSTDLSQVPALTPPAGVTPNFVNPETLAPLARYIIYITTILMVLFFFLRVYVRLRVTHTWGADDYLSIVAVSSAIAYAGLSVSVMGNPEGPHMWDVPVIKILESSLSKTILIITCVYPIVAIFTKTTLLVFYLRIFSPVRRTVVLIWAGIGAIVVYYILSIALYLYFTLPLDSLNHQPELLDYSAASGVFSVVSDFYVLAVPIGSALKLQMPKARKTGICAVFATGLLACACSVASAVYRFKQRTSVDYTWDSVPPMICAVAEVNVGIICSCLPVVFVVFKPTNWTMLQSIRRYISTRWTRTRGSSGFSHKKLASQQSEKIADSEAQLPLKPPKVSSTVVPLRNYTRATRNFIEMQEFDDLETVDHGHETHHWQAPYDGTVQSAHALKRESC